MDTLNCNGTLVSLEIPKVMGILNVTPDSFYDGGEFASVGDAMTHVSQMVEEGVDIIDVGGMSSRPGADLISKEEELNRVLPVIRKIKDVYPEVIISIDTVHGATAEACILEGASIINDISAGSIDPSIWKIAQKYNVPYILMHMRGNPKTMQQNTEYVDVTMDILTYLRDKAFKLKSMGVKDILIDPGFGFGKTVEQNFELLRKLSVFRILECPILVGISRKSMIYKLLNTDAKHALNGTTAAHMVALQEGAKILRVHDVKAAKECVAVFQQLKEY